MPKAILALRQYPVALLVATLVFLCSLIIATQSLGVIRGGGGDDQGSGMGGTGKSGGFGDSGFGGTGGPVPYLGDNGQQESQKESPSDLTEADWPAPWFPREPETAVIPDDMQPLIELQRNPPVDPFSQPGIPVTPQDDSLRIQDLANDSRIAPETRRVIELANRQDGVDTEGPSLEIEATIPEINDIPEITVLTEVVEVAPAADQDIDTVQQNEEPVMPEFELVNESGNQRSPEQAIEELRRDTPERINRPELPPFQRIRPAVDRASLPPPRPQPMRI